jgi:acylneuraminate cytidylyltransferase
MNTLTIIPARSGSKGILDKNIQKIGTKTLIEHAIDIANQANLEHIYINTDSPLYENIAINAGAKSLGLRPKYLSGDNIQTIDVVLDMLDTFKLQNLRFDNILLLQPTSPQRTKDEIVRLFNVMEETKADAVVSVSKIEEPHPYKLKSIQNGYLVPFINNTNSELPRQKLPSVYKLTGAYYLIKADILYREKTFFPKNTIPMITKNVVNIDTENDLLFAQFLYQRGLL